MKDWVKYKLDEIDKFYPESRLRKSKDRWKNMWSGEKPDDRYPFLLEFPLFDPYSDNHSPEQRLKAFLDGCIFRGQFDDDFIPSIFPGCDQSTIPTMLGARSIRVGIETTCEKLIYKAEDIDQLPEPSIKPGTTAHNWLIMEEYLLNETEGRIPVHVCDMQGPMDVCGQIYGYDNTILLAYENPEYHDKLLKITSDAFILLWKEQEKLLGSNFVGTHLFAFDWVPPQNGASLSADCLVMLSPGYYDEYYKSYLERIAKELYGISVHSCGNFGAVVPNLCRTEGVKAVNASQMSVESLLNAGMHKDKVVIAMIGLFELEKNMSLIKENSIGESITVTGIFPRDGEKAARPGLWTPEDWLGIRKREETVLEIMSV